MPYVSHPQFPDVGLDVPNGALDEWVAAGWIPEESDTTNETGPAGEES